MRLRREDPNNFDKSPLARVLVFKWIKREVRDEDEPLGEIVPSMYDSLSSMDEDELQPHVFYWGDIGDLHGERIEDFWKIRSDVNVKFRSRPPRLDDPRQRVAVDVQLDQLVGVISAIRTHSGIVRDDSNSKFTFLNDLLFDRKYATVGCVCSSSLVRKPRHQLICENRWQD